MTRSRPAVLLMTLAAVASSACGRPALQHLDGHALAPDFRFAPVERGWIAVDSCADGMHAVLELEIDSASTTGMDGMLLGIGRALRAVGWRPVAVQLEGPICALAVGPMSMRPGDRRPGAAHRAGACTTTYLVRAEYRLRRLPTPGERLAVRHRDRRIVVHWDER